MWLTGCLGLAGVLDEKGGVGPGIEINRRFDRDRLEIDGILGGHAGFQERNMLGLKIHVLRDEGISKNFVKNPKSMGVCGLGG